MSKPCTKCGETKPLDDFHRDKTRAGGRKSDCKECVREYERRYREENRDILNQGNKIYLVQNTRTSNLLASKKGAPYSPEEDALILADNGMTIYQKAIELGRTYPSVRIRKQRLLRRIS